MGDQAGTFCTVPAGYGAAQCDPPVPRGRIGHGLRDLFDLDRLLRHFAALDAHFWERLVPRAREMGMQKSLSYALRYCRKYFATPVPEELSPPSAHSTTPPGVRGMMDWLFERGFSGTIPPAGCLYTFGQVLPVREVPLSAHAALPFGPAPGA